MTRCEGYKRVGGVFTMGPVQWVQCTNDAIVRLRATQEGRTRTYPACKACHGRAVEAEITIVAVLPLKQAKKTTKKKAKKKVKPRG